jgi:energy-coupling factor transport system permease protein
VVSGCGLTSALVLLVSTGSSAAALDPSLYPLVWPALPLVPAAAILLAAVAGVAAPPPPRYRRKDVRRQIRADPPGQPSP